jgi:hypothetical protein
MALKPQFLCAKADLPGCRLNASAFRFFAKHPDKAWYFIGRPLTVGKLVLTSVETDLTTVLPLPVTDAAVTGMAFISRKL